MECDKEPSGAFVCTRRNAAQAHVRCAVRALQGAIGMAEHYHRAQRDGVSRGANGAAESGRITRVGVVRALRSGLMRAQDVLANGRIARGAEAPLVAARDEARQVLQWLGEANC